ncbi:hypothetical protein EON79_18770 [bacterium]|nr:MAG: hypothetical protein EON79_18770 [bacterium]
MDTLLAFLLSIDDLRDNATEIQLLAMIAILLVIVACGYMAFRQGQTIYLSGGVGVILVLVGVIYVCGRLDAE